MSYLFFVFGASVA